MISSAQYAKLKIIIYKCAVYSIALFLLGILQVTFFAKINVLSAVPDLLLAAIVLLSMREEHKISSVCALVSGVFYCSLGGAEYPLYIIFSFLIGYVMWIVAERSFGRGYRSFLALCAIAFLAKSGFNLAYSSLFSSRFALFRDIVNIVLPEFISSMLFCSISYVIFAPLSALINKRSKKGASNI